MDIILEINVIGVHIKRNNTINFDTYLRDLVRFMHLYYGHDL